MSPNPRGRGIHETNNKAEGKLLSCKQYNLVATFNGRSLKSESKRKELEISFKGQSIAILGVVDHKIVHKENDDDIVYDEMGDSILITSPAWRNTSNEACGGVGLMVISKTAASAPAEVKKWNGKIMAANFRGSPALTIIVHYSTVEGNLEAEDHYDQMTAAVREIAKHNMPIVMGDYNTHLVQSVVKYSYRNTCNFNGRLVKNFIEETNLFVANVRIKEEGWEALDICFGYEWHENTGRLNHGQQKMEELCTRSSIT